MEKEMNNNQWLELIHSEICYCREDIKCLNEKIYKTREFTSEKFAECKSSHGKKINDLNDKIVGMKLSSLKIIIVAVASGALGAAGSHLKWLLSIISM